jgi:hypothetical protein
MRHTVTPLEVYITPRVVNSSDVVAGCVAGLVLLLANLWAWWRVKGLQPFLDERVLQQVAQNTDWQLGSRASGCSTLAILTLVLVSNGHQVPSASTARGS